MPDPIDIIVLDETLLDTSWAAPGVITAVSIDPATDVITYNALTFTTTCFNPVCGITVSFTDGGSVLTIKGKLTGLFPRNLYYDDSTEINQVLVHQWKDAPKDFTALFKYEPPSILVSRTPITVTYTDAILLTPVVQILNLTVNFDLAQDVARMKIEVQNGKV
jgi:hypothetical protein